MIFEIYTDGSSSIKKASKTSSAAFMLYCKDKLISSGGAYYSHGTNNKGEASAILLGLNCLHEKIKAVSKELLKPPYHVTIIGDSYISIEGCRTWIYNWVRYAKDGVYMNSSGKEVANAEIFSEIYHKYLINKDYKIKFIHVNSHKLDSGFGKYLIDIADYFVNGGTGACKEIPEAVYKFPGFKAAAKTYASKNKGIIEREELLRFLYHNRECDTLASDYLNHKGKKAITGLGNGKVAAHIE